MGEEVEELVKRLRERAYAIAAVSPVMEADTLRNAQLMVEAAGALEILRASLTRVEEESVERCARIAETCELFNGDRLKNSDPRITIAQTIRQARLSRASGERRKEVLDTLAQSSQEILGDDY